MKRSKWLEKKGHAAETIRTMANGSVQDLLGEPFYVVIHDAQGRDSTGYGKTEEAAFKAAHDRYTKARHRAALSVPGVNRG